MACVVMSKTPAVQKPWANCRHSAVSFCFDVKEGYKGCVRAIKFPENVCATFELYNFTCCDTRLEYIEVKDPECACACSEKCPLEMSCECDKAELPAGRYRMLLRDCDGNPYIPDEDEVLVHVNHELC